VKELCLLIQTHMCALLVGLFLALSLSAVVDGLSPEYVSGARMAGLGLSGNIFRTDGNSFLLVWAGFGVDIAGRIRGIVIG